ncbi:8-oxo-dGTP diphosphatase [Acidianus brierleyi]|uniref:8-oxo-dGTP diphosphatase n=1 Tax=Acidianus brierleyi TaxID=41673 RepID=A0A2U9IGM9_9CREN|nr:8-oxo-dGTP diphosphatase [Acidianus brierleyi]AWR95159.1 NUDIX domain-containing protein [Acidianus brierleyi]
MELPTCLSIVIKDNEVLMIEKKRGLGKGLLTFPGWKIENETSYECALRELEEEVNVKGYDPLYAGRILFKQENGYVISMYVYLIRKFSGVIKETDEAKPFWQRTDDIPYARMWQDDRFWLYKVLSGKIVDCVFTFSNDWSEIMEGYC